MYLICFCMQFKPTYFRGTSELSLNIWYPPPPDDAYVFPEHIGVLVRSRTKGHGVFFLIGVLRELFNKQKTNAVSFSPQTNYTD
jgi:hypothetical protein